MSARQFLREPLVHFFVIGAVLFALYGWLNQGSGVTEDVIVVDDDRVDVLAMNFERTWLRPPNPSELEDMVDQWVREEIMYREGVAMGLDQNDPVFRRRVAQKMSFIAEGGVDETVTEAELQAWLDTHQDAYRVEPGFTFRQVFFKDIAGDGTGAESLTQALAALQSGGGADDLGDASLLPARLEVAPASRVDATFGEGFAGSLQNAPAGEWVGPLDSAFGTHLVFIENTTPARAVTLAEARQAVQRDLLAARRAQAEQALYETLREKYSVRLPDGLADAPAAAAPGGQTGAP